MGEAYKTKEKVMCSNERLDSAIWRECGAGIETAIECGVFGREQYVSVFDKKQADVRKEIVNRIKARWVNRPITYTKETP